MGGTGHIKDIGAKEGAGFSVNAPLTSGMTDTAYEGVFKPVMDKIMEVYRPGAIVLQCGADSLTGDRLGVFNLTLKGHAECVRHVKSFGVPTLVLGGGGIPFEMSHDVGRMRRRFCSILKYP